MIDAIPWHSYMKIAGVGNLLPAESTSNYTTVERSSWLYCEAEQTHNC